MPDKKYWEDYMKENPKLLTLVNTKTRKKRILHCFNTESMVSGIVVHVKRGDKVIHEYFSKEEWSMDREHVADPKETEAAFRSEEYVVPPDAPEIPVQKVATSHQEKLKDGTVLLRTSGDLTKERPGEYNAWAHRNDPPDMEAVFRIKSSVEAEYAKQEGMRQYLQWKAKRDGRRNPVSTAGGGVGVGIFTPER